VSQDAFSQISTIATTVVLVGGLIFGAIRWLNAQSDKKVAKAKQEAETTATELKGLTAHVAEQIKGEAEETARDLKALTERIASEMKVTSEAVNKEIMGKIEQVDKRVMEMLSDLRRRADLTNGNVATIRTEIQDLNDDLQELYEQMPEPVVPTGNGAAMAERVKRTREREKKQRMKRRKIEQDRVEQSERYLSQQPTSSK
jgi:uncharacterized phage infection (PIP) family protein YhgE